MKQAPLGENKQKESKKHLMETTVFTGVLLARLKFSIYFIHFKMIIFDIMFHCLTWLDRSLCLLKTF